MSDTLVYECNERVDVCAPDVEIPQWVQPSITAETVAAIVEHGLDSGVYMPAVYTDEALGTMTIHGDDVMRYLCDNLDGVPSPPADVSTWRGLAAHYLGSAVVVWAHGAEPEIRRALEEHQEEIAELNRNPILAPSTEVPVDNRYFHMVDQVGQTLSCEHSVWSIYTETALNGLLKDPTAIALEGPYVLVYEDVLGAYNLAVAVHNVTFRQLWQVADELIKQSGDHHHIFIEKFVKTGAGRPSTELGFAEVIELVTGS